MSAELARSVFVLRKAAGWFDVPCDGCTLCCKGDAVRILPHEPQDKWQTEPHPYKAGARMIAHKPNGDCFYLGESGCTIQHDKPQQCWEMDCRRVALGIPSKSVLKRLVHQGAVNPAVHQRGLELAKLHPMPALPGEPVKLR